jgi:hypothetical protein
MSSESENEYVDMETKYKDNKNKKVREIAKRATLKPAVGIPDEEKPKIRKGVRRTTKQIEDDGKKLVKTKVMKKSTSTPDEKIRYIGMKKNQVYDDNSEEDLPPIIIKRKPKKPQVIIYSSSEESEESEEEIVVRKKKTVKKEAVKKTPAKKAPVKKAPVKKAPVKVPLPVQRPIRPATTEEMQRHAPQNVPHYAPIPAQPQRNSLFDDCF